MPLLSVENLNVGYGDLQILWDLNLRVDQGEIVSLIGSNGAGKSTTLKTIIGILKPTSGSLQFDGKRINGLGPDDIVDEGVVYVPEGRRVFSRLTVQENLELGAYTARARSSAKKSLQDVYELFPILRERKRQLSGTLSGGEQQMLAIGRGLMALPRLLMFDEPSLGLAPLVVDKIYETIAQINKQGVSVIIVDQDVGRALSLSKHAYLLESGRIVKEGTSERLLVDEDIRQAYLGL